MPTEQIWQQSKVIALFGESDDATSIIEAAAQECGLNDLKYTGENTPAKSLKIKTGYA